MKPLKKILLLGKTVRAIPVMLKCASSLCVQILKTVILPFFHDPKTVRNPFIWSLQLKMNGLPVPLAWMMLADMDNSLVCGVEHSAKQLEQHFGSGIHQSRLMTPKQNIKNTGTVFQEGTHVDYYAWHFQVGAGGDPSACLSECLNLDWGAGTTGF